MGASRSNDLEPRLAFATTIARAAGRRLLQLRASGRWSHPTTLGDVGDQAADGYLQGALAGRCPDDAVLSEETAFDRERAAGRLTWIVDPLDGTREYSSGRRDWAVHVGAAVEGRVVLGAVALPAIDRVLAARCDPPGAVAVVGDTGDWPRSLPARAAGGRDGAPRLVVSRSHTPPFIERFAEELGGVERVPCGSVGFKVAMLLFGRADLYVHKAGLQDWDTCAPEAVARAAGFDVCRFDGSALRYDGNDPRHGEFVVCRPELRERVLAALRRAVG